MARKMRRTFVAAAPADTNKILPGFVDRVGRPCESDVSAQQAVEVLALPYGLVRPRLAWELQCGPSCPLSSGKSFPLDAASQHAMSTMPDLDMDEVHLGQLIILAIGLFLVGSGRAIYGLSLLIFAQ
jgi:hypothetical protein